MHLERSRSHVSTRILPHYLSSACVSALLAAASWLCAPSAQAQTPESVSLNLSTQNFTETGIGPYLGDLGEWDLAQGACAAGPTITFCTLSGTINSSTIAGLAGGSYSLLTSYANSGGVPVGISSSLIPPATNYFNYLSLPTTTSMVLTLTPEIGTPLVETLVSGGFGEAGVTLNFLFGGTAVCSNTNIACDPYDVGLTDAGNTFSAPVTTTVGFDIPAVVPLPASSGLLGSGLLFLIAMGTLRPLRRRLQGTLATAFAH
jgi:hypothetical protein